jgi:flagella basal body P-ring formation protein FlgA
MKLKTTKLARVLSRQIWRLASGLLPFAFCLLPSYAAEIQLRSECNASGLVRLGDVAEIHSPEAGEVKELKEIELFPAPAVGGKSYVRAREIQDLLALRGINLSRHRLTGSSHVEIRNGAKAAAPLSGSAARRATDRVEAAIAACLRKHAGKDQAWEIEIKLDDEQVRAVAASKESISASGGQAPFTGEQEFSLTIPADSAPRTLAVMAKVAAVPLVVVATRALVPGDLVQRTDVKMGQAKNGGGDILFHALEDVVGQQTKRALVEGQALKQDDLQSPLLVRRGDAVAVVARSAGIQVRTTGRAQEDGSKGDLIVIEAMLNRDRFMARVSGIHEVEVFAQTADANGAAGTPGRESTALRPARMKPATTTSAGGFRLPAQPVTKQAYGLDGQRR